MDFLKEGPKSFEKKSEILPLPKYGLLTFTQFKHTEKEVHDLEELKRIGLTNDEIKLYHKIEGDDIKGSKIETSILNEQIQAVYAKIKNVKDDVDLSVPVNRSELAADSKTGEKLLNVLNKKPLTFYPEGHPMNNIKNLESDLFNHLEDDNLIIPVNKRRKILRRLEKKKQDIEEKEKKNLRVGSPDYMKVRERKTLWDVKDFRSDTHPKTSVEHKFIGPKRKSVYTISNNKIVRLEPVHSNATLGQDYKVVDIVVPINESEKLLLEGTKLNIDDIKKNIKFKNYEPGVPSRILYLKNIAPSVTEEKLTLMFNRYSNENQGPVNVQLMKGRMRGQAFVEFLDENIALKALQDVNGTIRDGKPIIVEFSRNRKHVVDNKI